MSTPAERKGILHTLRRPPPNPLIRGVNYTAVGKNRAHLSRVNVYLWRKRLPRGVVYQGNSNPTRPGGELREFTVGIDLCWRKTFWLIGLDGLENGLMTMSETQAYFWTIRRLLSHNILSSCEDAVCSLAGDVLWSYRLQENVLLRLLRMLRQSRSRSRLKRPPQLI